MLTERDIAVITSAPVIARTDELTRAEWLQLRHSGLGGSDAAAVLGLSKWTSSYGLWLNKTGRAHELFLNSEGRWVFQPKRATPPRPPAKKAAPHRATA